MPFRNAQHLVLLGTALGHKRRLCILQILFDIPDARNSFANLQAHTRISSAPLRHHLKVLEKAGLIQRHHVGAVTRYRLDISIFDRILAPVLFDCRTSPTGKADIHPLTRKIAAIPN